MAVTVVGGGPLEFDALIRDSQFEATFRQIEQQIKSLTETAKNEGKAIEGYVQKVTQAIAAYASFAAASNFVSDVVRVRGEFQQLEVAFNTMLGSKEKADKLLAEATELAAKTSFTLTDVGAGAKQLLAYGFGAEEVSNTLKKLGDVAAGVSAPLNDIVYLYGTTRTQGRLYAQDLLQFTSRGIPIIAALAKQFNVAESEVKKLVEAGKVGFPEVEKVINSLTTQGGIFFNLMEEQSKTLTGQISNLQDAWDRMLNDIGKQNEGVLSGAIQAAISLVENYETVLDILKVIVITYGSYRAAIIATNAVTAISTGLAKGYTIAETLRFQAMVLSERATKLLNATMLSNPAVAITTAIVALGSALLIFGKRASSAVEAQRALNNVQDEAERAMLKEKTTLEQLLKVAQDETKSREDRLEAVRKLNAIAPETLGNLTLENLKTQEGVNIINQYVAALERKAKVQAAENALQDIAQRRLEAELATRKSIAYAEKILNNQDNTSAQRGNAQSAIDIERKNLEETKKRLNEEQKVIEDYINETTKKTVEGEQGKQVAKRRTVDVIEAEIKALKEERDRVSAVSKEYKEFEKRIAVLNKELEAITGKESSKASKKAESTLEKLLDQIEDAERRAFQSGLVKEESEIDRINQRYQDLQKKITELKADPALKLSLQTRVENARQTEVGNERVRDEVAEYKKNIDEQKKIFNDFEEAKKDIGVENAKAMFAEQTKGFDSFLEYLTAEGEKFIGIRNTLRGQLSLAVLGGSFSNEEAASRRRQEEADKKRLVDVIKATTTFNARRLKIEEEYEKDLAILRKRYKGDDLKEREDALKEARDQELTDLRNSALRQSGVYKKLNEDIIGFTRKQLKDRVRDLKRTLENDITLTPAMKADIQNTIDQLNGLLSDTSDESKFAKAFLEVANYVGSIEQGMRGVANSVRETNSGLADTIDQLADILSIAESGLQTAAAAATGDIGGAISGAFSYYTKIFDFVFTAPKKTAIQTAKELQAYQDQVFAGELEIDRLYRERARQQALINQLKLQGLRDEKKLLEEQKKQIQDQFDLVLAQLQKENAIVGKVAEQYGGIFGIGRRTRTRDITESLAGKNFQQLEELFLLGQLEGKAKTLFEQLQKLRDEGADIDKILADNAAAFNEAITGTTADSITDAILEGFKNGKRGATAFADDFEKLMQDAVLQALNYESLEGPLKEFYEQFSQRAESDGVLTEEEIRILRENFNAIITDAGKKFDELQQITNVDLAGQSGGSGNSLAGAIRGITQQQADLLAGQFGGLRITALDQLNVAQSQLATLQAIQNHTSNLLPMYQLWRRLETEGLKVK